MRDRYLSIRGATAPHGSRARYVGGHCRCDACKKSNLDYYHARIERRRQLAADVKPSGPALDGVIVRRGRGEVRVRRCPGANGAPCVRGGAWLRVGDVCAMCIERATVWNGIVSAAPAREHMRKLSRIGVGKRSVAAASSVALTIISGIITGELKQCRSETSRRILAVDGGARAGGALVASSRLNKIVDKLKERGFTKAQLALELGRKIPALQLGKRSKVTLASLVALEKLWRRAERGELVPTPAFVDGDDSYVRVTDLISRGLTLEWICKRLGFALDLGHMRRIRRQRAEAIAALYDEFNREHQRALRKREFDEIAASRLPS